MILGGLLNEFVDSGTPHNAVSLNWLCCGKVMQTNHIDVILHDLVVILHGDLVAHNLVVIDHNLLGVSDILDHVLDMVLNLPDLVVVLHGDPVTHNLVIVDHNLLRILDILFGSLSSLLCLLPGGDVEQTDGVDILGILILLIFLHPQTLAVLLVPGLRPAEVAAALGHVPELFAVVALEIEGFSSFWTPTEPTPGIGLVLLVRAVFGTVSNLVACVALNFGLIASRSLTCCCCLILSCSLTCPDGTKNLVQSLE